MAYIPIPYFPLLISFTPIMGGGGHGLLYPRSYASSAAGICEPRVKARERSDRVGEGCVSPSHGRDFFVENSCMKTTFVKHMPLL